VRIEGAAGGLSSTAPAIVTNALHPIISNCVRVDPTTHLTPMFSPLSDGGIPDGEESTGPPPNESVVDNCLSYTVESGDTLSTIAVEFDVEGGYQALFEENTDVLASVDELEVGDVLKIQLRK